jgi:hypothetical protein
MEPCELALDLTVILTELAEGGIAIVYAPSDTANWREKNRGLVQFCVAWPYLLEDRPLPPAAMATRPDVLLEKNEH